MATTTSSSSGTSGFNTFYKSTQRSVQKNLRYIGKKAVILGRMDGWDELAVAAANILPAYARPLFLTTTLASLSFPVSWGAQGMAADFQEMKDDVQGLKNEQVDLSLRLLASEHTPKAIKEKLKSEFNKNNENNTRLLTGLKKVKESLDKKVNDTETKTERNKTDSEKAEDITKAFKKLDIKFDDSDDKIESLLKGDTNKDAYNIVKTARDFIQHYKEADRAGKQELTNEIKEFVKSKNGTLEINDRDSNSKKDEKITKALQTIADDILEPRRGEYIVKLFNAYHTELNNKAKLKDALDKNNQTDINKFSSALSIESYEEKESDPSNIYGMITMTVNHEKIHSDILAYERNAQEIDIEQTPVTGYLGNMAMSGMTLGTAASAAKAGTQLLGQFGVLPNLMPALTAGLELVSSGTFVASQASMVAYGLGEAYKGMQKSNLIAQDKEILLKSFAITNDKPITETQKEQLHHIEQLQKYNTQKNTLYGIGIAAAEAGMIAGSLTGSSPLLMASALGTLACAGLRMVAQSAEANLTGDAHDHDHNGNPIAMLNFWKKSEIELSQEAEETGHIHTSSCNHAIKTQNFELKTDTLNDDYNKIIDYGISSFTHFNERLTYLNTSHNICDNYVKQNKGMIAYHDKPKAGIIPDDIINIYYINAIIANPTALENAKEILIDKFEGYESTEQRPHTKSIAKDLRTLKILKSNRQDKEALQRIFNKHRALLDTPQNAKKILKPLLQERIEILKAKKHDLINNMVHLGRIAEKSKLAPEAKSGSDAT